MQVPLPFFFFGYQLLKMPFYTLSLFAFKAEVCFWEDRILLGLVILIHLAFLCLYIGEFNLLTFKVIIDKDLLFPFCCFVVCFMDPLFLVSYPVVFVV